MAEDKNLAAVLKNLGIKEEELTAFQKALEPKPEERTPTEKGAIIAKSIQDALASFAGAVPSKYGRTLPVQPTALPTYLKTLEAQERREKPSLLKTLGTYAELKKLKPSPLEEAKRLQILAETKLLGKPTEEDILAKKGKKLEIELKKERLAELKGKPFQVSKDLDKALSDLKTSYKGSKKKFEKMKAPLLAKVRAKGLTVDQREELQSMIEVAEPTWGHLDKGDIDILRGQLENKIGEFRAFNIAQKKAAPKVEEAKPEGVAETVKELTTPKAEAAKTVQVRYMQDGQWKIYEIQQADLPDALASGAKLVQ